MIRKIANSARDYAWGSETLISDYFGVPATGAPMAEIWFGTHQGSPTSVVDSDSDLLALREGKELPFLLKILAAGQPLSIQAHPNKQQAQAGFERENAAGLSLEDPTRSYKDDHHKPEMIVALTDFTALIGFRNPADVVVSFQRLMMQAQTLGLEKLEQAMLVYTNIVRATGTESLVRAVLNQRGRMDEVTEQLAALAKASVAVQNVESDNLKLVPQLQELYPGDPGIIVAQLMNVVSLKPMEAAELQAGCIHAYVSGLGVEIMANSDNVLRGGLTAKHIDTDELLSVLDFASGQPDALVAKQLVEGLWQYPSVAEDYLLYRLEVGGANLLADIKLPNASIVLCTAGEVAVGDSLGQREVLRKGEAAYLADANFYSFSGSGTAFLATS
ncbi:MAG: hypothetical protein RJA35_1129 [Actinomycetota bacterium]